MKDLVKAQTMSVVAQQPKTPMELMAIAIQTTKQALLIERDECAKLAEAADRAGFRDVAAEALRRLDALAATSTASR